MELDIKRVASGASVVSQEVHDNGPTGAGRKDDATGQLKSIPFNTAFMLVFLTRVLAVGYFVIGLVWKVHSGLISNSWLDVLNRLYIGTLPLGTTVNSLVLTLISLFPVYITSGALFYVGTVFRSPKCIILFMVVLVVYVLADIVFIALLAAIINGINTSLSDAFLNQCKQSIDTSYSDLGGIGQKWIHMLTSFGCCNLQSYACCYDNGKKPCWDSFSASMTSYSCSFLALTSICFASDVTLLGLCDYLYSQMSNIKFPMALGRETFSVVKGIWKRGLLMESTVRISSFVPAICLLSYGSLLMSDDKMRGSYVSQVFVHFYFLGNNLTTIITGLAADMIVLGALSVILNIAALISDFIVEDKLKTKITLIAYSLLIIAKITSIALWITMRIQIQFDLEYQLSNYMRTSIISSTNIFYMFSELQCCGVMEYIDACTLSDLYYFKYSSACRHYYAHDTCCMKELYTLREIASYARYCPTPNQGCHGVILSKIDYYGTAFLISTSILTTIEVVSMVLSVRRLKALLAKNTLINTENAEEKTSLLRKIANVMKTDILKTMYVVISSVVLAVGLCVFIEGLCLYFDKVFNHEIIKLLWRSITFEGLTFNYIRTLLCRFMISLGLFVSLLSGFGMFIISIKSRFMYVLNVILLVTGLVFLIIGTSLWAKMKHTIDNDMEWKLSTYLASTLSDGYFASHFNGYDYTPSGTWNNLFAVGECCGVTDPYGNDFASGTMSPAGDKIPIYCCKSNPLAKSYDDQNNTCQDNPYIYVDLQHGQPCKDKILTRLDSYSTPLFVFLGIMFVCLVSMMVCLSCILWKRKFPKLRVDKYYTVIKGLFKTEKVFCVIKPRVHVFMVFTILSSLGMVIVGVVIKHDSQMTGDDVEQVYKFFYFHGVNLIDIIEALYVVLITHGVVSLLLSLLGLTDVLLSLKSRYKMIVFIVGSMIAIFTKMVFISLWIAVHVDIALNSHYQLQNVMRQYPHIYTTVNRYFVGLSCCGNEQTDFAKLILESTNTNNYSPNPSLNQVPTACCSGNVYDSSYTYSCQKEACNGKFHGIIEKYSIGFFVTMTMTLILEIVNVVKSIYQLHHSHDVDVDIKRRGNLAVLKKMIKSFFRYEGQQKTYAVGILASVFGLVLAIGLLTESVVLRYDAVFANRQIIKLWDEIIYLRYDPISTQLKTWRWLMFSGALLVFATSTFVVVILKRHSKIMHCIALTASFATGTFLFSQIFWWISAHSSEVRQLLPFSSPYMARTYDGHYDNFTYDDEWNNLFHRLQCCGFEYWRASNFPGNIHYTISPTSSYTSKTVPIFCCTSNPLAQQYLFYDAECMTVYSTTRRYTDACKDKIEERLTSYSIGFYILSVALCFIQVTVIVVLIRLMHGQSTSEDNQMHYDSTERKSSTDIIPTRLLDSSIRGKKQHTNKVHPTKSTDKRHEMGSPRKEVTADVSITAKERDKKKRKDKTRRKRNKEKFEKPLTESLVKQGTDEKVNITDEINNDKPVTESPEKEVTANVSITGEKQDDKPVTESPETEITADVNIIGEKQDDTPVTESPEIEVTADVNIIGEKQDDKPVTESPETEVTADVNIIGEKQDDKPVTESPETEVTADVKITDQQKDDKPDTESPEIEVTTDLSITEEKDDIPLTESQQKEATEDVNITEDEMLSERAETTLDFNDV